MAQEKEGMGIEWMIAIQIHRNYSRVKLSTSWPVAPTTEWELKGQLAPVNDSTTWLTMKGMKPHEWKTTVAIYQHELGRGKNQDADSNMDSDRWDITCCPVGICTCNNNQGWTWLLRLPWSGRGCGMASVYCITWWIRQRQYRKKWTVLERRFNSGEWQTSDETGNPFDYSLSSSTHILTHCTPPMVYYPSPGTNTNSLSITHIQTHCTPPMVHYPSPWTNTNSLSITHILTHCTPPMVHYP